MSLSQIIQRSSHLWSGWVLRRFSSTINYPQPAPRLPEPQLDLDFLLDPANKAAIAFNITNRKGVGDIDKVHELGRKAKENPQDENLKQLLVREAEKIPNQSHPKALDYGDEPKVILDVPFKSDLPKLRSFDEVARVVSGVK